MGKSFLPLSDLYGLALVMNPEFLYMTTKVRMTALSGVFDEIHKNLVR